MIPDGADQLVARIGGTGVYATPAELVAFHRTHTERLLRTVLTFAAVLIATPLGFLIPPHFEPAAVIFLLGLYFTRRAWVAEWDVVRMLGTCPRCDASIELKRGTVLYLPHSITCRSCRSEVWLEVGEAPHVDEERRKAAMSGTSGEAQQSELGGKPPGTWSPAASNWRDRA